jgi:hypothetical protein
MTKNQKTIEFLQRYNKWQRGVKRIDMPSPTLIGIAIDDAIKCIEQRNALAKALMRLHDAADAFAADQSGARDERCGLVQPVSVAECEELNQALKAAWELLNQPI